MTDVLWCAAGVAFAKMDNWVAQPLTGIAKGDSISACRFSEPDILITGQQLRLAQSEILYPPSAVQEPLSFTGLTVSLILDHLCSLRVCELSTSCL